MMAAPHKPARVVAASIVGRWLESGQFPDRMIPSDHPEHGFILDLVYGTVRWKRTLEWAVRSYVRRRPAVKINGPLLMGVYQLLLCQEIPDYAAINETVDAANAINSRRKTGFVNAVLRAIQRDRDSLLKRIADLPLGLRYSHPDSLIASWSMQYGPDIAAALCRWDNDVPSVSITTRPDGPDVTALQERLAEAGIVTTPHTGAPAIALSLAHGVSVGELISSGGLSQSEFVVQDPSTLMAVELLDIQPGQRVLDACAAPGGKAIQLAARLQNQGELVAAERHEDRMPRLRKNLADAGVAHLARVVEGDAADADGKTIEGRFDRILLDVPCSNTGVLRRRPDARWRFDPRRLKQLNMQQRNILDAMAIKLKPGGLMVYSTCSLNRRENDRLVRRWLKHNRAFEWVDEAVSVPISSRVDGAYAALIRRTDQLNMSD